jgi:hypothetical protein
MTDYPGHRRSNPSDHTEERTSDPVPVGDEVIDRDEDRQRESEKNKTSPSAH